MADAVDESPDTPPPAASLNKWSRRLISAWLLYHVLGIAIAPLGVSPTSPLLLNIAQFFRPYLQASYLNHGFHYFAPEPGTSTLVEFQVERPDGSTVEGVTPYRDIWPRLLYHRHFMLTESLSYVPDSLLDEWHESYARCLARKHHGRKVHLTQVVHFLPRPEMVLDGMPLDHPSRYEKTELGFYESPAEDP
ncbi:MAG: hypothetical protein KF861_14530 [Planctomycetaceae bacterium]|nr:hypothetical protein [Planctomycetaceae bacterium]